MWRSVSTSTTQQAELFVAQRRRCTTVREHVAVVDLHTEAVIHAGNRLMVYALYPESLCWCTRCGQAAEET
jgi:hypothetical protein